MALRLAPPARLPAVAPLPRYEEECFFIAPIGADGGETRRRSDGVLDFIVTPAAEQLGLQAVRADKVAKPGQITLQVVEHVLSSRAVVADLTGANANVFYELAIRHTAKLPVVLICEADEIDKLPFDIQQMRVIPLDHRDLASAAAAREAIVEHLQAALDGAVDSPISTVLNLQALEQGTSVEQTLADLVTRVDTLSRTTAAIERALHDSGQQGRGLEARPWSRTRHDALTRQLFTELAEAKVPAHSISITSSTGRDQVTVGLDDGQRVSFSVDSSTSPDEIKDMALMVRRMADRGKDEEGRAEAAVAASDQDARPDDAG